jgi:transposase
MKANDHPMIAAKKLFYETTGAPMGAWSRMTYEQRYEWISVIDGPLDDACDHDIPATKTKITDKIVEQIIELHLAGKMQTEIAQILGIADGTVYRHLKRLKKDNDISQQINKLYQQGHSMQRISVMLNVTYALVDLHVHDHLKKDTSLHQRDAAIVADYHEGMSIEELVAKYHLGKSRIYHIVQKAKK